MQKQFTLTGIVTLLAVLGAGILLTVSLQKAAADNTLVLPSWMLWSGEICLYLAALLIWAPNLRTLSLAIGLVAMLALRLLIGVGSALVYSLVVDGSKSAYALIGIFLAGVFPRSCSALFALMAFYPLRVVLPRKGSNLPEHTGKKAAAQDFVFAASLGRSGSFQYGMLSPAAKSDGVSHGAGMIPLAASRPTYLPDNLKEHKLSLPLAAISLQLPGGFLRPEILERAANDSLEIEFPLALIAPQLKEAHIQLTPNDLLPLLPKGWVAPNFEGSDDKITLPLSAIIPQVPEELFKLPEVTPPAWIKALDEEDKVLFAQV